METRYTWDPAKAERNRREHGVSFDEAAGVFGDPHVIVNENHQFDRESEQRYVAIGMTRN